MKKSILTLLFFLSATSAIFAQAPEGFKYQAVVRDASNAILANQSVGISLSIQQGAIGGTAVYTETFALTSNAYGLINLEIGSGITVDDFSAIDWSNGPYFIETSMDVTGGTSYVVMGTSQLISVPYALYANTAENVTNDMVNDADADPNNELQVLSFSNDTLYLNNGGSVYLGAYAIDNVIDADADPLNELQFLSQSGNTISLSGGGGSITDQVNDADADPLNEIQSLQQSGLIVTLSNGGGFLNVADNDNDASNELQTLSVSGSDITISGGNTVSVPSDADGDPSNELQTISKTGNTITLSNGGGSITDAVDDADSDASNELQTISKSGNTITLSNGGGSITDAVDDADASPTNELQTLSVSGSDITISGGNTVTVPFDDDWAPTGVSNIYRATGNVGIGSATPIAKFHVNETTSNEAIAVTQSVAASGLSVYSLDVDLDVTASSSLTQVVGVRGSAERSGGPSSSFGGYFAGSNSVNIGSCHSYGVYGYGYRSVSNAGSIAAGIYATAGPSAGTSWGGYFSGDVWSTGSYLGSDKKLKSNIQPMTSAFSLLNQINTYTYEYKTDKYANLNLPKGVQMGIMAQEVETVFPGLIKETVGPAMVIPVEHAREAYGEGNYTVNEEGMAVIGQDVNFKAVNYVGLIPVLIQSIKEQQAQIDELQEELTEVEQLKAELAELKAIISDL